MSEECRLELWDESMLPSRICAQLQGTTTFAMRPRARRPWAPKAAARTPAPGPAGPGSPRRCPPIRESCRPGDGPSSAGRWKAAPTPSPGRCRPRPSSSRGTGSAARILRCGRRTATPPGAGSVRSSRPRDPWSRGTPPGSRPGSGRGPGHSRARGLPPSGRWAASAAASTDPWRRRPRPGTTTHSLLSSS
ncbi:hypothetical protein CDEF62S_05842 [Castellaniella defragrans]